MARRIVAFGFPSILILLEHLLRVGFKLDSQAFVGPALAAVGIGFLFPLIVPKVPILKIPIRAQQIMKDHKMRIVSNRDLRLIEWVWIFIFVLTISWTYSLYLSSSQPYIFWFKFPASLVIGFINYFLGMLFCEIKGYI